MKAAFSKLLWSVSCALLAFAPSFGGELYVDYNYTDGGSDGSFDKPYTTLNDAVTALGSAGGTVYLKKGTHQAGAAISLKSGLNGVTISGAPGATREEVILDGGSATYRVMDLEGSFTLANLTIQNGRAQPGGGIRVTGSAAGVVSNCVFKGNVVSADNSGAIQAIAPLTIVDSTFENNQSAWQGGAIYGNGGKLTIDRCRFIGNKGGSNQANAAHAVFTTAGCTIRNSYFDSNGDSSINAYSVVHMAGSENTVENCTFTRNAVSSKNNETFVVQYPSSATVRNCLFVANTRGTTAITHTDGSTAPYGSINPWKKTSDSKNNLTIASMDDAQFDTDGVTPLEGWAAVVDAGLNQSWMTDAKDLLGNARIYNTTVDIGAAEYSGTGPVPPPPPPPARDIWWVDASYTGGGSDGSEEKPFTTVEAAAAKVESGNTIYIKKGTYNAGATITLSVSDVTISGAPGEAREDVILDGGSSSYVVLNLTGAFTIANLTVANGRGGVGGAITLQKTTEASVISNCVFTGNITTGNGGAIQANAPLTILDSVFENNRTEWEGGAVYGLNNGALTIERCSFIGNKGSGQGTNGHAIHAAVGGTVRNSYFYNNGNYNNPDAAQKANYILTIASTAGLVENCTFTHNGVYSSAGAVVIAPSASIVRNCLFVDNTRNWNKITSNDASIWDVASGNRIADLTVANAADAQFDTDGVTPLSTWTDVVDTGSNQAWMEGAVDFNGKPRIVNDIVDIGAAECQGGEPPPPPPPPTREIWWVNGSYTGDDSDGSEEKPFKTVEAAAAVVDSNDIIYIKEGSYVPATVVNISASDVMVSAAPGVAREDVVIGGVSGRRVFELGGSVTLANLTVANVAVASSSPSNGGGILFGSSTTAGVISNCVIRNCKSPYQAGAIDVQGPVTIVDSVIENNETTWEGGAIRVLGTAASLTVDRCRFTGNKTQNSDSSGYGPGHVIHAKAGSQFCTIRNSYFYGNGDTPSTVYKADYILVVESGVAGLIENCTFTGNILWRSTGSVINGAGTVRNCLFVANVRGWGNISSQDGSIKDATTIEKNWYVANAADAQFDADGVTPLSTWTDVVDTGLNQSWMTGAKDLLGNARIYNTTVDIGAVEYSGGEPPDPPEPTDVIWVDGSWTGDEEGTEAKPYKHPSTAFENVVDGGTIYIRKGTYACNITKNIQDSAMEFTVAGAPGTTRDEVILSGGGTQRVLETKNIALHLVGLTLANGYFSGNNGGAWKVNDAGADTVVTASNCVFSASKANGGAAIYAGGKNTIALYDCEVSGNTTLLYQGAVRLFKGSSFIAHRCRFLNNVSVGGSSGHVLHFSKDAGADYGACDIRNCLFKGNGSRAASGNSAIALIHGSDCKASATVVESCTFVGNGVCSGNMLLLLSGATVRNCLFADNTVGGSEITSLSAAVSGASTDASSKCFTKANAQFDADGVTPLSTWSAVVDAGVNQGWMTGATDLLGNARVYNTTVDIGAVEYQGSEPPPPPPPPPGDALYVSYNYDGESDGSYERPYKTLNAAVAALDGEEGTVYLKAGTHAVGATIELAASGVTIAGEPGATRDQVTLDGDQVVPAGQNGYVVLNLRGSFTIANLTIANGRGGVGGAITLGSGTEANCISNCVFKNNITTGNGGAIQANAPLTVVDSVFEGNGTSWEGGAIYMLAECALCVDRCRFTGNTSKNAQNDTANVIHSKGALTVRNCGFVDNGFYNQGQASAYQARYLVFGSKAGTIDNCTFVHNGFGANGCSGKAIKLTTDSAVHNCLFVDNTDIWTLTDELSDLVEGPTGDNLDPTYNKVVKNAADAQFGPDGLTALSTWTLVVDQGETLDWMAGAKDVFGRARVVNGAVDIGAAERPAGGSGGDPILIGTTRQPLWAGSPIVNAPDTDAETVVHRSVRQDDVGFTFDAEWESGGVDSLAVFAADGALRLYYVATDGSGARRVCLLTSADGRTWTRPAANNAVLDETLLGADFGDVFVFRDANPGCPAGALYKAVFRKGATYHCVVSADGRTFADGWDLVAAEGGAAPCTAWWDATRGKYVLYCRGVENARGVVRVRTSDDFTVWSDPERAIFGEADAFDFATGCVIPDERMPGAVLAFPTRVVTYGNSTVADTLFGLSDGTLTNFVCSASAYLRPGPKHAGAWEATGGRIACGLPLVADDFEDADEMQAMYFIERVPLHPAKLYRRMLRADGFRSFHGAYDNPRGVMTSLLQVSGTKLFVNFSTGADGYVRVTIRNRQGAAIATSLDLFGDRTDREVDWKSGSPADIPADGLVVLEFTLKNADVYSFHFGE